MQPETSFLDKDNCGKGRVLGDTRLKNILGGYKKHLNADLALEDDMRYTFRGFIVKTKICTLLFRKQ